MWLDAELRDPRVGGDLPVDGHEHGRGRAGNAKLLGHFHSVLEKHMVEALFKALARALRFACSRDARLKRQLPSTKGLL